ncbi:hypothetical protein AWN90_02490 [Nocardia terpenica]|uniref:Uncharacterized protein n=1 Tax=Nocardia terpenica TaxID=455432 RepID=A0A164KPU4_9NOCA|nr:hypothetical protein AWN90_02490 [Nocardia terpenica]
MLEGIGVYGVWRKSFAGEVVVDDVHSTDYRTCQSGGRDSNDNDLIGVDRHYYRDVDIQSGDGFAEDRMPGS